MSGRHRSESDPEFRPEPDPELRPEKQAGFGPDVNAQPVPRRNRQPMLMVLALLGILLLVLAVSIFGGIF